LIGALNFNQEIFKKRSHKKTLQKIKMKENKFTDLKFLALPNFSLMLGLENTARVSSNSNSPFESN